MSQQPTIARFRHGIDRGRSRDKVDVIDPATVPLGTDDEAAGTPPASPAVKRAQAQEIRARGSLPLARDKGAVVYGLLVAGIAVALALAIWLA